MTVGPWNESANQPALVTIGDIIVTPDYIRTPQGERPVGSVHWTFTDLTHTTERIPPWAIVLAIVFALFCLLGLFFLLVKERNTFGAVQVGVQGPGFWHTTQLPIRSHAEVVQYANMVEYAKSVSASRGGW